MKVETTQFKYSHSAGPRGRGHWLFYFKARDGSLSLDGPGFTCLYSEARDWALRHAKERGAVSVEVAP